MEKNKYYGFPANGNGKKRSCLPMYLQTATSIPLRAGHAPEDIGYDVRWYTSETYSDKLRKLGIPHYPFNRAFDFSGGEPDDVFPERAKHKSQVSKLNFDLINVFILRATEYFEDIQEIYQEFPFDLVIADVAFGALPFVREKMHIPAIAIGVVPLTETSRDLGPASLGLTPASGFFVAAASRM